MVTKRFFRMSFIYTLIQLFFIFLFLFNIYFVCVSTYKALTNESFFNNNFTIFIFLCFYFCLPFSTYFVIQLTFDYIKIDERCIATKGDLKFGRSKIQYKASVNYIDISNISIYALSKSSKGNRIYLTRPVPFLCIKTKDNKTVRFVLYSIPSKKVRELLEELCKRCSLVGNDITIDIDSLVKKFKEARWAVEEDE